MCMPDISMSVIWRTDLIHLPTALQLADIGCTYKGGATFLYLRTMLIECARSMFDDNKNPFWDMMNDIDDSRLSHSHLTYLSHSHLTYCRFDGLELYLTNSLIALCHTMLAGDVTDSVIYSSVPEQLKVQQLEAPDDLDLDDDAFAPADAPPVGGPEDDGGVNADLGADTFGVAAEAPPAAESPSLNRVVAVAKVGGASAWFNQD